MDKIEEENYRKTEGALRALGQGITRELGKLFADEGLTLAVPIEMRVKTWSSIREKMSRQGLKDLKEIHDQLGVRIIFLFKRDLLTALELVQGIFKVQESEDLRDRLEPDQFGYLSNHYELSIPDQWAVLPTFNGYPKHRFELQMRTAAQHIWAAYSHKLGYKIEQQISDEGKRNLSRVAALLELVDLEIERNLERLDTIRETLDLSDERIDGELNIENLPIVIASELDISDQQNRGENYSDLLWQIRRLGIVRIKQLKEVLSKNISLLNTPTNRQTESGLDKVEQLNNTGKVRYIFSKEYGTRWDNVMEEFYQKHISY